MAKRFTDTEKWKDEWFLELEPLMKLLWLYILDTCDHAGVWKVNFKLASYSIGTALDRQSAIKALGDRIQIVSLDKWHVPKFITYQQKGFLNPSNNAHKGILNLLEYHKIQTSPYLLNANTSEPLATNSLESLAPQVKVKVKVKDSSVLDLNKKEEEAKKNLPEVESQEIPKIDNVIQLFNDTVAGKGKVKHCQGLSSKNIQDYITTTSYQIFKKLSTWQEMFMISAQSDFLTGQKSGSSFVVTLNWLVIHDNALSVINGQYGSGSSEKPHKNDFGPQKVKPLTDRQIELLKASGQI